MIDATHDQDLRSWVESAQGHQDFPIQNLPLGIFSPKGGTAPRAGVAIGDQILDLPAALAAGLFSGPAKVAAEAAAGSTLNNLMSLGAGPRRALRTQVSALLQAGTAAGVRAQSLGKQLLHPAAQCLMSLPGAIGSYTDFYAGINHAMNVGRLFRQDNPLLPNYKYVPIGYHSRPSSIRPSGVPVKRPAGQTRAPDAAEPTFGPSRRVDIELEVGFWVGPGNELGEPVPIGQAADHIAGYCLLNDWSARDIQAWEYQPLGPFLAKSFHSTISPWVITPEALEPFRIAQPKRPEGDPRPLPYLWDEHDQSHGALDLPLEVFLTSEKMRQQGISPLRIALSTTRHLYWTTAQMLTHHTSNGCNLQSGDLLGTGTISATTPEGLGSLLEMTEGGKKPIQLPTGEQRTFVEDGDEIVIQARAQRSGFATIGFGECRAMIRA
jgi:fumarylacetoacetase